MLFRLMDLSESSSMCIMVIRPRCCIVSVNPTEKSARKIGTTAEHARRQATMALFTKFSSPTRDQQWRNSCFGDKR
jgi:hypothetical protein